VKDLLYLSFRIRAFRIRAKRRSAHSDPTESEIAQNAATRNPKAARWQKLCPG
jgi:hypothetical protein